MAQHRYASTLVTVRRRVFVPVPFDPDVAWGHKVEHHVRGTINGMDVRGVLESLDHGRGLVLGPAWRRDRHLESGATVEVMLEPEGPQRDDLADDIAAQFAAHPDAAAFFDSIAQFYRRAYLRYIDATKRRPHERAARITEVVTLLAAGVKERPKPGQHSQHPDGSRTSSGHDARSTRR
ncbi:MAG: YdeI/OmpD-associated family protein [Ilumatobacteraceae bacterium]